jgi:hypothetical protein
MSVAWTARIPVLVGTCRPDLVSAIAASTAAMSTLSRHLSHLVDLLNRGSFRAAEEYVGVVAALPARFVATWRSPPKGLPRCNHRESERTAGLAAIGFTPKKGTLT